MHEEIHKLIAQIGELESQLRERLHQQQTRDPYHADGKRIRFTSTVRKQHRGMRIHLLRWLAQSEWRNVVSAPFIFALFIPFALLDLFLALYLATCFPLYRLKRPRRSDFIVIDHQHLDYLNSMQRLNCVYCSYVTGLIAYAREIASVTEQYWCPIKHAGKIIGTHARYAKYLDYGETENIVVKVRDLRQELREAGVKPGSGTPPDTA